MNICNCVHIIFYILASRYLIFPLLATLSFLLNGEIINPPQNWKAVEVELSYVSESVQESPSASLSETSFDFVKDNVEKIETWLTGGLNGSLPGIFEGMPMSINLDCPEEGSVNLFNGYLDLSAESAEYSCDKITVPFVESQSLEWLRSTADSFSFAYLASKGIITKSDYTKVYYTLNRKPDLEQGALISIAIFLIVREVAEAVHKLASAIKDFITIFDPGSLIRGALAIVLNLIYFAAVMVALITLLKQLVDALFPIPKYYHGMRWLTLFEKGCAHLGLNFQSTIFESEYKDLVYLPAKFEEGKNVVNASNDTGYPEMSFGQFIDRAALFFNARIDIIDSTLIFERKDLFNRSSGFVLRDLVKTTKKTNASQVSSNFLLKFATDATDTNSIDKTGLVYQVTVEPLQVGFKGNLTLRNLDERSFPFARAARKTKETRIEKLFAGVFDVFNKLIGLIRGRGRTPRIGTRLDYMMLNADFFSVDKVLMISSSEGLLAKTNESLLHCAELWKRFHFIDSPVPTETNRGNQWEIYEEVETPMCCEDLKKVRLNNLIYIESEGAEAKLISCKYNVHTKKALLSYKVQRVYTNNLKETHI